MSETKAATCAEHVAAVSRYYFGYLYFTMPGSADAKAFGIVRGGKILASAIADAGCLQGKQVPIIDA